MRLRKYGVQATIDFEVYGTDGVDLNATWVPAQADCEIMKDGGASTLCDNTATDEGVTFSVVLTATEMEFARGVLKIQDAATKVILDTVIHIETYGNASAQHAFDLDTASAAQTADNETRLATIETDTNEIQGKLPTNKFMGSSDGADDDGNIAAILTDTGTTLENRQVTIAGDVANIDGASMVGTDDAALASVLGAAVGASISADIAAVKAETATIVTDTGTTIPGTITTMQNDLDTITGASGVLIDTDAVDADALKADAVTKIWAKAMQDLAQGAPSATASALDALNYLYEAWRNKTTTTATLITVTKDDGSTGLVKSTISDDATTFTKGEFVSGV